MNRQRCEERDRVGADNQKNLISGLFHDRMENMSNLSFPDEAADLTFAHRAEILENPLRVSLIKFTRESPGFIFWRGCGGNVYILCNLDVDSFDHTFFFFFFFS